MRLSKARSSTDKSSHQVVPYVSMHEFTTYTRMSGASPVGLDRVPHKVFGAPMPDARSMLQG